MSTMMTCDMPPEVELEEACVELTVDDELACTELREEVSAELALWVVAVNVGVSGVVLVWVVETLDAFWGMVTT
jgi:hypothetical protein